MTIWLIWKKKFVIMFLLMILFHPLPQVFTSCHACGNLVFSCHYAVEGGWPRPWEKRPPLNSVLYYLMLFLLSVRLCSAYIYGWTIGKRYLWRTQFRENMNWTRRGSYVYVMWILPLYHAEFHTIAPYDKIGLPLYELMVIDLIWLIHLTIISPL